MLWQQWLVRHSICRRRHELRHPSTMGLRATRINRAKETCVQGLCLQLLGTVPSLLPKRRGTDMPVLPKRTTEMAEQWSIYGRSQWWVFKVKAELT